MTEQDKEHGKRIHEWRNAAVDSVLGCLPRQTAEHLVNAQKEGILAIRSLLDRGIEALDGDLKRVNERPARDK